MIQYLGGERFAGSNLKEAGTQHWDSRNVGATNSSGFTALPGGYRNFGRKFESLGMTGFWWTSTEIDNDKARDYYVNSQGHVNKGNFGKLHGRSVRCVKDQRIP